jgi:WD40 repeat protein
VLALQFDAPARMAFAGDFSGHIYVLKITGASGELVSKLSAHTGSVRSLAWDMDRQWLFSGAYDGLIIVWDIGGRQGSAYELK